MSLASGTVTFLFTDIEGSTRLLERSGDAYPTLLETHRAIIRAAVEGANGHVFGTEGDAVFASFERPSQAVRAAALAQRGLAGQAWPADQEVRVRMGIHTGEAILTDGDYVGIEVHRAARIAAAAHGGQVLLSEAATIASGDHLDGITLRDLGLHRLKDLSRPERIAQLEIDGLTDRFPPIRTLEVTPNNLPIQLTSFVGRETELAETRELIERTRLLTLTGPGGTGKTRLALALAAELTDRFPDGVRWVELEPIVDAELVAPAVADALETADPGRPALQRIVDHLKGKRVLILLDNVEQVIAAASLVAEILRRTTSTQVVATSRIALDISGEQLYPVPPLPLPTPDDGAPYALIASSPAVQLFVERARSGRPDFTLTPDSAPAVARIVRGLDGLPLAIELAAARVRILPPSAIEARLGDRLALLASSSRDLTDRQRTIRGAIAWSHDLLTAADRRLFARLGIFNGGAAVEEIEAVCGPADDLGGDVIQGIESLTSQSLLRSSEDLHGDPRFAMYMTIADFARERLTESGEVAAIRDRHARVYLDLAETIAPALTGADRRRAIDRLADESDNLRGAMDTLVELGQAEEAERLVAAIWRFWQFRGHLDEGSQRATAVLAMSDGRRPDGLPRQSRLHALAAIGGIGYWRGDRVGAHRAYAQQVALARELGDHAELGEALFGLSFAPEAGEESSDYIYLEMFSDQATDLLAEALAEFRAAGDDLGAARVLWQQGDVLSYDGKMEAAAEVLEEALALFERHGDHYWAAWARHILGLVSLGLGDHPSAAGHLSVALREFQGAGDVSGITLLLFDFAELALARGDEDRMRRLLGSGLTLGRRTGSLISMADPPPDSRYPTFDLIRGRPAEREAILAMALPADEAVAYALAGVAG